MSLKGYSALLATLDMAKIYLERLLPNKLSISQWRMIHESLCSKGACNAGSIHACICAKLFSVDLSGSMGVLPQAQLHQGRLLFG